MSINHTETEYILAKAREPLSVICDFCGKEYKLLKYRIYRHPSNYCSNSCGAHTLEKRREVECLNCHTLFFKGAYEIKDSPNHFCSRSCSAVYNNIHKKHGTRRSKLEVYLEEQLTILYPTLEIHFNRKDAINSELDIYIPSLNLAFELNGLFHYESIFGVDKLEKIENNDQLKFKACIDNKINLCVIDTSGQKRFTIQSSQKYLDIITNIIST